MRALLVALVALCCLTGCRGGSTAPVGASAPSPGPIGVLSKARLESMLLQASDLPGLGPRRTYAGVGLITQSTPQLALCRAPAPVGPHQLANVIADSAKPGGVKVFEVVSAFADEAAAKAAFAAALADARACSAYSSAGVGHRIASLTRPALATGTDALQYALVTSDVVSGDVRTYARRGVYTVLISGFGAAPTKEPLLAYQAALMRKALSRLG